MTLGGQERSFHTASRVCTEGALCVGVQWGACGEMHACALLPLVKVAEGQDLCAPFQDVSTFLLFFFLFFWQRLFPALSKPVNEVPVTPDRACLWRHGRRKKAAEGEGRQSIVLEARELLKH